jgi:DNA-binding transcriptional ArsR family regulator
MLKEKMIVADQELVARFAKALGHPTRVEILVFLASQDSCFFGDIHDVLPMAKSTVSQHLKELRDAGLIKGEIEAPKVRYCINKDNWDLARSLFSYLFRIFDGKAPSCK